MERNHTRTLRRNPVFAVVSLLTLSVPLLLAIAAVVASYMPARRAAAVDPAEALKVEQRHAGSQLILLRHRLLWQPRVGLGFCTTP